jgi:aminopeptidase N
VEIDQETRWDMLAQLARNAVAGSDALVAAEVARDDSEDGQLAAIAISALRPDAKVKAEWLAKIQALPTDELPYAKLRVAMMSLYPAGQEELAAQTQAQRLDTVAAIDAKADRVFMRSYSASMLGGSCTADSVKRLQAVVDAKLAVSEGTRRDLESELETDQRCLAIRQKFDAALK